MEITIPSQQAAEKLTKKTPMCPKCKTGMSHRIHRGFFFKTFLSWVSVKRYYCYKCKRKHYVWN